MSASRITCTVALALVTVALGLAGCGGDPEASTEQPSRPAVDSSITSTEAPAPEGCELAGGVEVAAADLDTCTLNGQVPVLAGYTDCKDGTALYVTGESNTDPAGGWIVFPGEDQGTGTWTVGPWEQAWNACYGY